MKDENKKIKLLLQDTIPGLGKVNQRILNLQSTIRNSGLSDREKSEKLQILNEKILQLNKSVPTKGIKTDALPESDDTHRNRFQP